MLVRNELRQVISNLPVLVVDDSGVNCAFIEQVLRERGFTNLRAVDSGEAALGAMEAFSPDLVILDLIMPGIDGFECCRRIRDQANNADLPILVETAVTDPKSRYQAFESGATDFINKPICPDELYARVRVHLENRICLKELRLYKQRTETELESARQLQLSILPGPSEIANAAQRCHLEVAAHYEPSSELGGDFWGMKNLFPHQTAFWLVDFSGNGPAAALNAFRLQAYIKESTASATRPGDYLSYLNERMLDLLLRGQFATMFYGIVDTRGSRLFYATACSPNPILLRHGVKEADILSGRGSPLGVSMNMYPTQSVPFVAGDLLMLYSDALTETETGNGLYISEQEIANVLMKHRHLSCEALLEKVLEFFRDSTGGKVADDLTIVLCRRS
jgi:sigma-B regulation protein RsbU (phosphoserine phosphatase)